MNEMISGEDRATPIGTWLAAGLGAAGLAAGVAAMVMLQKARQEAAELRDALEASKTEISACAQSRRSLEAEVNRALQQIGQQFRSHGDVLNTLAGRIAALSAAASSAAAQGGLSPAAAAPPAPAAAPSPSPAATGRTYTVEPGDNFARIARKLNVPVSALEKANPDVQPSRLKIGQKINVP